MKVDIGLIWMRAKYLPEVGGLRCTGTRVSEQWTVDGEQEYFELIVLYRYRYADQETEGGELEGLICLFVD